jgi:signal transduction histidine kinase
MVTERFFRGRAASSKGSGLGLAIARELTEKWGGTMTIDQPDGGGTRVEVRFRGADRTSTEGA